MKTVTLWDCFACFGLLMAVCLAVVAAFKDASTPEEK